MRLSSPVLTGEGDREAVEGADAARCAFRFA